ncbi:MAG: PDZ domain-containing protein, partial [Nitrospirota bacterium]|nr:PDZ domain-containing protein [Nitrospirota bacterium]
VTVVRNGKEIALEVVIVELPTVKVAKAKDGRDVGGNVLESLDVEDITSRMRREMNLPAEIKGVLISDVKPETAAESAGLQEGDIIEEVNRQPVRNFVDFTKASRKVKAGENVLLLIFREGNHLYVTVTP